MSQAKKPSDSNLNLDDVGFPVTDSYSRLSHISRISAYRYNPYANRRISHPTTDTETLIHLLKGSLGSGLLAMPMAFSNAGLWLGMAATILVGAVCTYCVHILVKSAFLLCQLRQMPSLAFADVAEVAFLEGPIRVQKFAKTARFLVNFFLVIDLLGCCCVYTVFVGTNLKQVLDLYLRSSLDVRVYMAAILPLLLIINMVRRLKYLAPLSLIANICIFLGLLITGYYVLQDLPSIHTRPAVVPIERLPIFFGTAIFALEGIGVVLPLENNMKTPEDFLGCPGVLTIGMAIVVFLYILVGFLGYLRYGPETRGSITLNLPDEILAQSVKVMIAIAMFFTFTLQFYVPMQIIWHGVRHHFVNHHTLAHYILRILLVTMCVVIAILIPNLGPFISLVGAVCLSFLGLMFPSVIELVVLWDEPGGLGRCHWILWKNVIIIIFGIIGFFSGSYCSIIDMIETYGQGT